MLLAITAGIATVTPFQDILIGIMLIVAAGGKKAGHIFAGTGFFVYLMIL